MRGIITGLSHQSQRRMSRPIVATIHRNALRHNLQRVRSIAKDSKVWAVVKANAYGHGLSVAVESLEAADGFALLSIEDAIQLREAGCRKPILLLEGVFGPDDYMQCATYQFTPVIHSTVQLDWLANSFLPRQIPVYLKLNTGMNRLGFAPENVEAALTYLKGLRHVNSITLMTHFAQADVKGGANSALALFDLLAGETEYPHCVANSAAILDVSASHRDWVRPGIMLYGASPYADRTAAELDLQPAMTLSSELIATQYLMPGDAVGYGATFVADRPVRIGVVACGYADGYPRHAPTGTPVLVDGHLAPLLGRVSMDMLAVHLGNAPDAAIGSPVELWGKQLPIDEVAKAAGTIAYELLCAVAPRVPVIVD